MFHTCRSCTPRHWGDCCGGGGAQLLPHQLARHQLAGCDSLACSTHTEAANAGTGDTAAAAAERNYFRYQAALQREAEPELTIQLPAAGSAAPPQAAAAVDAAAGSSAPGGGAGAQLLPGVSLWRASVIC